MNYIEIMGGLGNQLFQYTFSKYIEKITSQKSLLFTNFYDYVLNLPLTTARTFSLNNFALDFTTVNGNIVCQKIITEDQTQSISSCDNHVFFRGYWQDKKYFEENSKEIVNSIKIKDSLITQKLLSSAANISTNESISIHVRRCDYLNSENSSLFVQLPIEYYENGINYISNLIGHPCKIYVFSDDIDYCKNTFSSMFPMYDISYVSGNKDYEDLFLMTKCKHHIIANSTFSWWGAALSAQNSGIVIAPGRWYKDNRIENMNLQNWIAM